MKLNMKRVLKGSLIFIGIGIVLVILSMILQLLALLLSEDYGEILQLVVIGFALLQLPIFLAMYFYAGMRAVKVHGLDAVGAGLVAAVAYFVVALVNLFFDLLLNLLVISGVIPANAGFGSAGSVIAAQVFGDIAGMVGLGASAICGFGLLLTGALINFVIGGCGGLFAQK